MNKKNKIIYLSFLLTVLLLIVVIYFKISLDDKYFPYWDTYDTKLFSETFFQKDFNPPTWDPIYYGIIKIFHNITKIDYFYIIKYGYLIFVAIFFFVLKKFFEKIIKPKNYIQKSIIILGILYYFLCYFTYIRFSMTLRENLIISLGILFLGLIYDIAYLQKNSKTIRYKIIIASILYAMILSGHILVGLVCTGTVFLYLLLIFIKSKKININLVTVIITGLLMSSYYLYKQVDGIVWQIRFGEKAIESGGFTVSRDYINLSYFNLIFDSFLLILFLFTYFKDLKNDFNKDHINIIYPYSLCIIFLYLTGFVEQFGIRQNRIVIYIYIIFALFFINAGIYFTKNIKKNMTVVIIPLLLIIILTLFKRVLMYKTYRPINGNNINYLNDIVNSNKININQKIFCGPSVCSALKYIYTEKKDNFVQLDYKNLMKEIRNNDNTIVLFYDDYFALSRINQSVLEYIRKSDNMFLEPKLEKIVN